MPVPDFAHGVKDSSYWLRFIKSEHTKTAAAKADATQTASSAAPAKADSGNSFFDDMLDVVNPLQHLPIVGTVYRAITGDKIGDVEKVAGDTLYGGPIGLVSSLADVAFEKITGKDFGDTVMAFVGLDHSDGDTVMAANTPKPSPKALTAGTAAAKAGNIATKAPAPLSQLASITPLIPAMNTTANQTSPAPEKKAEAPSGPIDISANTDALLSALARNGVTGQMQTQALDAYRRTMSMNTESALTPLN
ncbi:MAG: hypothetical protein JSR55_15740 [Proteobacteria bacterium]|nr:hypothetical protein [Pseudomonadota bacterium]